MREVWVEAKGFPNYLVSNLGNVVKRENHVPVNPFRVNQGRKAVNLKFDSMKYTVLIHRLVASSFFVGEIEGMEVNHIDGDRTNNFVGNLEIVTREENEEHGYAMGLIKRPIQLENLDTGEIYRSCREAGQKLGLLSAVSIPKGARERGDVFRSGGFRLKII